jgi:hypothetical protein
LRRYFKLYVYQNYSYHHTQYSANTSSKLLYVSSGINFSGVAMGGRQKTTLFMIPEEKSSSKGATKGESKSSKKGK